MSHTHELAWAAGFFDGEGFVSIQKRQTKYKEKTYVGYYLRIGINHVAPEPLQEIHRLFGGTLTFSDKVVGNRKPRWRWQTNCGNAASTLKQLMPYLKNKNKVASIGLDLHATIGSHGEGVSEGTLKLREDLKTKLIHLNSLD